MNDILDKLRGSVNAEQDRNRFLSTQLLFWMLAAPDGHAKNFSIHLLAGGVYADAALRRHVGMAGHRKGAAPAGD